MRLKKVLWIALFSVLLLLCAGITFTIGWRPFIGPRVRPVTDRKFDSTPARLERGSYLVNGLFGCLQCHSEPDHHLPGWPAIAGREGAGRLFDRDGRTPFWQARFYDFNVWTSQKRVEKLRYMHRNPVKRELVESAELWRWSSYRFYLLDEAGLVRVNQGWTEISFRDRVA